MVPPPRHRSYLSDVKYDKSHRAPPNDFLKINSDAKNEIQLLHLFVMSVPFSMVASDQTQCGGRYVSVIYGIQRSTNRLCSSLNNITFNKPIFRLGLVGRYIFSYYSVKGSHLLIALLWMRHSFIGSSLSKQKRTHLLLGRRGEVSGSWFVNVIVRDPFVYCSLIEHHLGI